MIYTTINELKRQLNIEASYDDENTYLEQLLNVSELAIANDCNGGISGYTQQNLPITIKQAMLMLATHLYLNRQPVAFANAVEIPYSIKYLISSEKNLLIV